MTAGLRLVSDVVESAPVGELGRKVFVCVCVCARECACMRACMLELGAAPRCTWRRYCLLQLQRPPARPCSRPALLLSLALLARRCHDAATTLPLYVEWYPLEMTAALSPAQGTEGAGRGSAVPCRCVPCRYNVTLHYTRMHRTCHMSGRRCSVTV